MAWFSRFEPLFSLGSHFSFGLGLVSGHGQLGQLSVNRSKQVNTVNFESRGSVSRLGSGDLVKPSELGQTWSTQRVNSVNPVDSVNSVSVST
ncbi:hypothetical protein Hanom_Chr16g01465401 [Helianthus anomalus]